MEKPNHYKSKIDPREYITTNNLDFNEGNIIKYVTRWRKKNGLEDLLKAKDYLEFLIELAEQNSASIAENPGDSQKQNKK